MNEFKLTNVGNLITYDSDSGQMLSTQDIEIIISGQDIVEIGNSLPNTNDIFDCKNKLVTPGFVDCHTHPIFFKGRENEFQLRTQGLTYEEIAKKGGGINSSVIGVRNASKNELIKKTIPRMDNFLKFGTTTIEAKSGYGLDCDSEIKSLKVIHELNSIHDIDIVPTFMGAHSIPDEFKKKPELYIDMICDIIIPEVAKQNLAVFNDVFCEDGYFNINQAKRILSKGKEYGLYPRIHSDEFKNIGATSLAIDINAVSADHLMNISEQEIKKMSTSNTSAVILPGTTFCLGKNSYAPYSKMKNAGIEIAIATDYNPGSCNIQSMPFIILLALIYMKMDIIDAIYSSTYVPAKILKIDKTCGSIEVGKAADLIIWNTKNPIEIAYNSNFNPIMSVIKSGKIIF